MNNKKLMILGVVAAGMVALAIVVQRGKEEIVIRGAPEGSFLIQGLKTGQISGIVVGVGEEGVRLVRQGGGFVVANKGNYPAVIKKINNLLTTCMTVRTVERITSDPDNHEKLEVTEEKARTVVKFLGKDEKVITGLVVGKTESETDITYVRLVTDNDVYSVKDTPVVQSSPVDYIEKEIANVDRDDVVRATITGPNSSYTLRVEDDNDKNITLEDLREGKKLKESEAKNVLGALSYFSFNDVKKESEFEAGTLKFDRTYVSELKDSTVYTFDIAKADDETYVKCRAEYTDKSRVIEEGEELKKTEAKLLARDQAADFARRHQGWVYTIPDWKAKNLTKELSELVEADTQEEKEEAEEETESQDQAGPSEPSSTDVNEQPAGEQPG